MLPVNRWELYRLNATKAPKKKSHETLRLLERWWGLVILFRPPPPLPLLPVDDVDEFDDVDEEDDAGDGCFFDGDDAEPRVLSVVMLDQPNSINPLVLFIAMIVEFFDLSTLL
jgi:hypothetical protein